VHKNNKIIVKTQRFTLAGHVLRFSQQQCANSDELQTWKRTNGKKTTTDLADVMHGTFTRHRYNVDRCNV